MQVSLAHTARNHPPAVTVLLLLLLWCARVSLCVGATSTTKLYVPQPENCCFGVPHNTCPPPQIDLSVQPSKRGAMLEGSDHNTRLPQLHVNGQVGEGFSVCQSDNACWHKLCYTQQSQAGTNNNKPGTAVPGSLGSCQPVQGAVKRVCSVL